MATLRKMNRYDWKDSNIALLGSDLDRNVSIYIYILMGTFVVMHGRSRKLLVWMNRRGGAQERKWGCRSGA